MALICDICKTRPADARITFMRAGQPWAVDVCRYDYTRLQSDPNFQFLPNPEAAAEVVASEEMVDVAALFSESTQVTLQRAAAIAHQYGAATIEGEHVLYALTEQELVQKLLAQYKISSADVQGYIDANVIVEKGEKQVTQLSVALKKNLAEAYKVSRQLGHEYVGPEHLLVALASHDQGMAGTLLRKYGLTAESLRQQTLKLVGDGAQEGQVEEPSATPQLDKYSRDLTQLAESKLLDPVIGRAEEIQMTIEILSRRTKNNPVLVGEPGVGKTAIVEGLAQRIVNGNVPDLLKGKRVVELNLNAMVAGTRYRGDFEERINAVLHEIRAHKDELIVFIDELHAVVGAGSGEGGLDAANVIKPSLARGELHLVGATTLNEYQKYIEKDAALERRFQPVTVGEPSESDTVAILRGLRPRYEEHHKLKISEAALESAVTLSSRYITNRFLPDKAIDVVDQAAARVRIAANEKSVEPKHIAQIVSSLTGVPVTELTQEERTRLLNLEERLHERVIGQEAAINAVSNAIRISRAGLTQKHSPIATFLFLGPTGVGKTELAKALAQEMFGSEEALVRIDMSEYMERHAVSRLIGSPPGYVGYEEGGQLTEAIRRRPYSVILLDEIEKAHPDVYNLMLQLLDDGRLTDGKGRVVDFSNTLIIATSNLGTGKVKRSKIGFATAAEESAEEREHFLESIKQHFRPEFVNRIDDIIVFHPLAKREIEQIVGLQLANVAKRLKEQKITLKHDKSLVKHLAEVGYVPEFGARELRRKVKVLVENAIAQALLEGKIKAGKTVSLSYKEKQGVVIH